MLGLTFVCSIARVFPVFAFEPKSSSETTAVIESRKNRGYMMEKLR